MYFSCKECGCCVDQEEDHFMYYACPICGCGVSQDGEVCDLCLELEKMEEENADYERMFTPPVKKGKYTPDKRVRYVYDE